MTSPVPRVSIGVPVYNGELYLERALDSILAQSFDDFEVIIADNASDDRTEQICRDYACRDARVRYVRNETNLGASANFNRTFALARGPYFKWAAHDDVLGTDFLLRCVEVLDSNPDVVLCHTKTQQIDEDGRVAGNYDSLAVHRRPRIRSRWTTFSPSPCASPLPEKTAPNPRPAANSSKCVSTG